MRRVLVAAIALVVALSSAAAAQSGATFVIKGKGWGHGLGLAQYGAYGFARDGGRNYKWILNHFYRRTTLGTAGVGRVRVLVADRARQLSVGSTAAFSVKDVNGRTYDLDAGTYVLGSPLRIRTASGQRRRLASPVRFRPGSAVLRLSGNRYRGLLRVRTRSGRLSAVNDIGLEPYIKGVIAWEMPASWHPQALSAQAVVARTYGLVSRRSGAWFDLYDDTRSQVYGGVRAEHPRTNDAVNATRGEVVRSNGALAWTFYHSTSGGMTASRQDEWGPPGIPYLVSVNDPHDDLSPHHRWGSTDGDDDCPNAGRDCVWTASALKRELGSRAPASIRDFAVTVRNSSKRVARARLSGPSGSRSISGATLRSALGLRSTWFSIGVLQLSGGGAIQEGQRRTLRALTRNIGRVTLQRRTGSGSWVNVRRVRGEESVNVRPRVTTYFRLRSRAAVGSPVKVTVRQAPRFYSIQTASSLSGVASPGDLVQVQRHEPNGSWATVAAARADEAGTWRAVFGVVPGVYRASTDAAGEITTSPTLTIVFG
jgi:stage II sporulation protein D